MHSNARIVLQTETTTVLAVDGPTHGGACHVYEVRAVTPAEHPAGGDLLATITFQHGPIKEYGVNGVQHVDLLAIIRHRLDGFQSGPFASGVNDVTRGFIDAAMASDATRTRLRELAGTEGTSKV